MATYVNDLRLKEIGTGESSGTWGTETNTNLELIGEALGFGTEAITTNADTHTTTVADGSTDPGRAMYIKYTGTLDSACTITIAPNTMSRMHFIENGTSGSQNIIISQGTGANVTIPAGDVKAVYLDGAGSGAAVADAFASLNTVDLKVEDDLTVTDDATIGGTLGVTGVTTLGIGMDIDGSDDLRLRFLNGSTFKGGIQVPTSTGDMISGAAVDDLAIRSQGDIRLATGGNTERMNILDTGINVTGSISSTVTDNSDNLTLTSTDADANSGPNLRMYRNSGSPADSDAIGLIDFEGRNDNSQDVVYAAIDTRIVDASDGTEDGRIEVATILAGTAGVSRVLMDATETVFNDNSKDLNFRVESDGNANMLFVDGGNNVVTVGGATFESADTFCVRESGANSVNTRFVNDNDDANGVHLILEKSSSSPADDDELAQISFFGRDDAGNSNTFAAIQVFAEDVTNGTEDGMMKFSTIRGGSFTEAMRIDELGRIGINRTPAVTNAKLEVGGADNVPLINVEASGNTAGFGIGSGNLSFFNGTSAVGTIALSTGTLQMTAGAVSSPTYSFVGDTSTGISRPSGSQVNFVGGGSEKARINSGGGLSIGTADVLDSTCITAVGTHTNDNVGIVSIRSQGSDESACALSIVKASSSTSTSNILIRFGINDYNSGAGMITVSGSTGAFGSFSDGRLKENIEDLPSQLGSIMALRPVSFDYKEQEYGQKDQIGFVAQEVEEVYPDLVGENEGYKITSGINKMEARLIKAIQEQQEQIEQLKTQIETLQ